jgi:peptidoglycan/xylan/chitin deacetylase (PgdA/CDA1 family)
VSALASRALSTASSWLGLHHLARRLQRRQLLVVCYHGVVATPLPRHVPSWHHVPLPAFERQLRYLRAHYDVVPLDEALDLLAAGAIDRPTAAITFDDGYRNNREVALPVLRRLGLPATIFLITGWVGTDERLWSVRVEAAFRRSTRTDLDLSVLDLGVPQLGSMTKRAETARNVIDTLKNQPPDARATLVRAVLDALGDPPFDDGGAFRLLSWPEIRDMEDTGRITFGAHTAHHEIVSRLTDVELENEIAGSIATVRRHTLLPSAVFAYPNGRPADFDDRARDILVRLDMTGALTTIEGLNDTAVDPFLIRRVVVGSTTTFDQFRAAAAGLPARLRRLAGRA